MPLEAAYDPLIAEPEPVTERSYITSAPGYIPVIVLCLVVACVFYPISAVMADRRDRFSAFVAFLVPTLVIALALAATTGSGTPG